MNDGIIKADGTSRLMRAELPATYEEFRSQAAAGTLPMDILFNAAGWTQLPTFLNKGALLKDLTAALYGLGADAVPDDVLAELGKYKQYWWRRRIHTVTWEISTTSTGNNITVSTNETVQYADSVHVENDGTIVLDNPKTSVPANYNNRDAFNDAIKNYWKYGQWSDRSNVWYGGNPVSDWNGNYAKSFTDLKQVIATKTSENIGEWEFIQDTNRNAYPDSGNKDGFDYQYIGVPLDNAVTAPKIETGSYVGTGTYGQSNPTTLEFDAPPLMVFVVGDRSFFAIQGNPTANVSYGGSGGELSLIWSGNSLSWYVYAEPNAYMQLNIEGNTYYYIAIKT